MKLLLTGANGQLGTAIQQSQSLNGINLIRCPRQILDLTEMLQVEKLINYYKPDWIINAAAYTTVDPAENAIEKAYAVNCLGVTNLAKVCAIAQIPVLHISTDFVFSGTKKTAYQPDDIPDPLNVYGASKLAGEQALLALHSQSIVLRTSWLFSHFADNFVKTILCLLQENQTLKVVDDQIGTPTAAKDLADVILKIIYKITAVQNAWGIYHYSNEPEISRYDFACNILQQAKVLGLSIKTQKLLAISSNEYSPAAKRPSYSALDCTKIAEVFGIKIKTWHPFLIDSIQRLAYADII